MLRSFFSILLALFPVLAVGQSYQKPPDNGYWWNPSEPGRGWTIETQNDIVAVTHYGYETGGDSAFLQTVSAWNPSTRSFTAELSGFGGGSCFGCPIRTPAPVNLGQVTFSFSSEFAGQVRYPNGTTIPIQRFDFGYANPVDFQLGTWVTAWYTTTSDFSNLFFLSGPCSSSTPANCVQGQLKLDRSGRPVVSAPVSGRVHLLLIDSVPGFYDYYYAIVSAGKMTGVACTRTTTQPAPTLTQCTGLLFGYRQADLIESRRLYPTAKLAENGRLQDRLDRVAASAAQPPSTGVTAELLAVEEELVAMAEKLRTSLQ